MRKLRQIVFWMHLVTGIAVGVIVLVMSATGVLLTFEKQMTGWADRRACGVETVAGNKRLPADALVESAAEQKGSDPGAITVSNRADAPVEVSFGRQQPPVFLHPVTGTVIGNGAKGMREFFRKMRDWHRWLATTTEMRAVGKGITGVSNLAFLFIVVSGMFLWLPRAWNWAAVRSVLWFRGGLEGRARYFNWHNVIGLWCAVPLLLIVVSGAVISYQWAGDLVYRVVGEKPPVRNGPPDGRERRQRGGAGPESATGGTMETTSGTLEKLFVESAKLYPGWKTINLQNPTRPDQPVTVTVDEGTGGQPQKKTKLTFNADNGELVKTEPFSAGTRGARLRSILRFAHTGEVGGLTGQAIAGLASAGACVLVLTGFTLTWKRWRTRRRRFNG